MQQAFIAGFFEQIHVRPVLQSFRHIRIFEADGNHEGFVIQPDKDRIKSHPYFFLP